MNRIYDVNARATISLHEDSDKISRGCWTRRYNAISTKPFTACLGSILKKIN